MSQEMFRKYAARLGFPESETMLSILELIFPDASSRAVFSVLARRPASLETMAEESGMSAHDLSATCARLVKTGAIARLLPPSQDYALLGGMIELRDQTVLDPDVSGQLIALWERLLNVDFIQVAPAWREKQSPAKMRVVPMEKAIPVSSTILDIDSVRNIMLQAEIITAIPCACRIQASKAGGGHKCPAPRDVDLCLQTNRFARLILQRGIGEEISAEEALRRLELAEQAGLVHQIRNNVKKDMIVCSCCSCCCTARFMIGKVDMVAKSRFQAVLQAADCNGCAKCVKACIYNAVSVDRKLPKEERKAVIEYEKCFGCGNCALICPKGALNLQECRPPEHVRTT